jgi:hypothetical protein
MKLPLILQIDVGQWKRVRELREMFPGALILILYCKLTIREHKYHVFHNKSSAPSAGDPRSFRLVFVLA